MSARQRSPIKSFSTTLDLPMQTKLANVVSLPLCVSLVLVFVEESMINRLIFLRIHLSMSSLHTATFELYGTFTEFPIPSCRGFSDYFHREMEEPSQSTSRFSAENG